MCVGNRAPSAAHYINKQVQSLWELSNECVEKHGVGIKATRAEVEYGSALSQICIGKQKTINPSVKDLTFFASFGAAPQIKFICNHDILLIFTIKSGHYRLDGRISVETFEDYTCAFRVPYHYHDITDLSYAHDGPGSVYKTRVVILDFRDATFIREFSSFKVGNTLSADNISVHHQNIIKNLTTYYFPLLRKAGYHCLHSLPDFDNLSRPLLIDHSTVSSVKIETLDIFGISILSINNYLTDRWLEATAIIDRLAGEKYPTDTSLIGKIALAEHRGVLDDLHFHAFFGPPEIQVRCPKEVIFTISAQELNFYPDGGFDSQTVHTVSDWRIALIVDAYLVEEEGSSVRRLRLDFSTNSSLESRFSETHSVTISQTIEKSILTRLVQVFITYVTRQYVVTLEEHSFHYIYTVDRDVPDTDDEEIPELDWPYEDDGSGLIVPIHEFKEKLTITDTLRFDIITTVSQGSVNDHFRSLWKVSRAVNGSLSSWAYENQFDASFGPLMVQFPVNDRSRTVILYVNLIEGFIKTVGLDKKIIEDNKFEFSNWRLAFEVQTSLRDTSKTRGVLNTNFGDKPNGEWIFKQLVLNFSTARVRYDLSRLSGIRENFNSRAARNKCDALLRYISRFYFSQLAVEEHDVLYSFPLLTSSKGPGSSIMFTPTWFDFQFLPAPSEGGKFISSLFGRRRDDGNRNMLVICGMLNGGMPPSLPLSSSGWRWSPSDERFSGVLALSSKTLLDRWLLKELQGINERTTLVPLFHGIGDAGAWDIEFLAWCDHPSIDIARKKGTCSWNKVGASTQGGLEYQCTYKDNWTYTHEGDVSHIYNGGYSISCHTTNSLVLPTVTRRGACEIKIKGRVDLKLSFSGGGKSWWTSASADWTASIIISTEANGGGLKITSTSSRHLPVPTDFFGDKELVHPGFKQAAEFLQHHLSESRVVLIEQKTIGALSAAFSGVWPLFQTSSYGFALGNPVFNTSGDLLVELVPPFNSRGSLIVSDAPKYGISLPGSSPTNSQYKKETGPPYLASIIKSSSFSQVTKSTTTSSVTVGSVETFRNDSSPLGLPGTNGSAKATTKDLPENGAVPTWIDTERSIEVLHELPSASTRDLPKNGPTPVATGRAQEVLFDLPGSTRDLPKNGAVPI
ncbi:hypothetical protein BU17DRAFT_66191 [Hysterangium stoloniferum]|nr:hypothetical protein BU17DRAFT_66191 [Hysterangium stoloniferum]